MPVHITSAVIGDMSDEESIRVTNVAVTVACTAADVARGRIQGSALYHFMDVSTILKLTNLAQIITAEHNRRDREGMPAPADDHALFVRNAPVVPRRIHAMITSPDAIDMVLSVSIGNRSCCITMGWHRRGSHWVCETCDIG